MGILAILTLPSFGALERVSLQSTAEAHAQMFVTACCPADDNSGCARASCMRHAGCCSIDKIIKQVSELF